MKLVEELLFWTRYLAERGLISGTEGNLSIRGEEGFFITPSGRIKETLTKKDIAYLSWNSEIIFGKPSSEWGLHLKIYQKNPEARAIVHTHPPYVLIMDALGFNFREFAHPEGAILLNRLARAPYFPAGSYKLWEFASNLCVNNCIVVLARHGVVAWGKSLEDAVNLTLILEKLSKMEYLTKIRNKEAIGG